MSTNTEHEHGNGAPSHGGALTEAEKSALVAEAARLGIDAMRAVAALVGVAAVLALSVLMAVGVRGADESAASAVSCAQNAPYGNGAPC